MSIDDANSKLSDTIKAYTREKIEKTQAFVQSVKDKPLGHNTVSIMINGVVTKLNQEDYYTMKVQNDAIKAEMKSAIKAIIDEYKTKTNNS